MDTRLKCFKLLWELFEDECPFLKKFTNAENQFISKYGQFESYFECNCSDQEVVFMILLEILPVSIIIPSKAINTKIIHWDSLGKINISYFSTNDVSFITGQMLVNDGEFWSNDIWQAILFLLVAIEYHPEKDKMKFVWGNK